MSALSLHIIKANDTVEVFKTCFLTRMWMCFHLPKKYSIGGNCISRSDHWGIVFWADRGEKHLSTWSLRMKKRLSWIIRQILSSICPLVRLKGIIITFSMVKKFFIQVVYLLVDEIENHFNKEIVATMRFFMDSRLNKMAERLFSLRIIRNCWTNMTERTEFVSLETVMALQQKIWAIYWNVMILKEWCLPERLPWGNNASIWSVYALEEKPGCFNQLRRRQRWN